MRSATWDWIVNLGFLLLLLILFANIEWGKVETVEYHSKSLGAQRRMIVYLPPGYSSENRYPVLYLLHGAGDDQAAWLTHGSANVILDNLLARRQIMPMIVVMPDGFVRPDLVKPAANGMGPSTAFEDDLLYDVIPYVDAHFATIADADHRAIAGVSMGGGRALDIALGHLDTFAWVGGFSASFRGREPNLISDPQDASRRLRLLWVSCGDQDHLLELNRSFHTSLEHQGVPHIWHVGAGDHEWSVWRDDLSRFAQLLFCEDSPSRKR